MKIEIEANINASKAIIIKDALKTLAEKLDSDNLTFLAEIAQRPNVNATLKSKKTLIKTFV